MVFAEDLVDLLAQKNLATASAIDLWRKQIVPKTRSAEDFAKQLVENGFLTSSLAQALLRQLQSSTNLPLDRSVMPPLPPPVPPSPPPAPVSASQEKKLPLPVPTDSTPVLPFSAEKDPTDAKFVDQPSPRRKKFSKKRQSNIWDTKLILFGGTALFLLVLLGIFLTSSLFRRSAESMFSGANQFYEKGDYSQAIVNYEEFAKAFPNHSDASTARIRLALARIRIVVDAKSDWLNAFETARTEIDAIRNEAGFFEQSRAELAVLLPKIASGLAEQAVEKNGRFDAERGKLALEMIDELLPRSLQPVEQIAEAKTKIDGVFRRLLHDNRFEETKNEIMSILEAKPFDKTCVDRCIASIGFLLKEYPELESEGPFVELMRTLSQNESRAVRTISEEELPRIVRPEKISSAYEHSTTFYHTEYYTDKIPKTDFNAGRYDDMRVFLHAKGSTIGLRASDGKPLWRKKHDVSGQANSPRFVNLSNPDPSGRGAVLVADSAQWNIDCLDADSGETLWRLSFEEPFYLSEPVLRSSRWILAATTQSGRLAVLSVDPSDPMFSCKLSEVRLPRTVDSPPVIDPGNRLVYQFASAQTLFCVPLFPEDEFLEDETREPVCRSFHVEQKPTTIRVAPILFGSNILFVRQTDIAACELLVFSPEKETALQRFPIRGLVDAPLATDGSFLALASDAGETSLFESTDDPDAPLKPIARGSAGGDVKQQGIIRYVALYEKTVWTADRQLMQFETQSAQSRLLPKNTIRRDIVSTAPLERHGEMIFHAFRDPASGGVCLSAVSLKNSGVVWETEFAESILAEPVFQSPNIDRPESSRVVHTSGGKSYKIDPSDSDSFEGRAIDVLPRGTFGTAVPAKVVSLRNGFEAWVSRWNRNDDSSSAARLVMIYDPGVAKAIRFRSMTLASPLAAEPIAFGTGLLAPMRDGRIALLDPKTGQPAAEPFVSPRSVGNSVEWGIPVEISETKKFAVVDNGSGENKKPELYIVALDDSNDPAGFVLEKAIPLQNPVSSAPVVWKNKIVFGDNGNRIQILQTNSKGDETPIVKTETLPEPCAWGPYAVDDKILWATNSKIYVLKEDLNILSTDSSLPVGKPFADSDGILLNHADGTLSKIDPNNPERKIFSLKTDVRTRLGPVRIGDRIAISSEDGTVYFFQNNAP